MEADFHSGIDTNIRQESQSKFSPISTGCRLSMLGTELKMNVGIELTIGRGVVLHTQPFRIRRHDTVVSHLDEKAGAVRSAMQVPLFGGASQCLSPPGARDVTHARCQCREDGIKTLNHVLLAADHHAVAAFQTPHAAARAYVHIMNPFRCEFPGAADVVHKRGVFQLAKNGKTIA